MVRFVTFASLSVFAYDIISVTQVGRFAFVLQLSEGMVLEKTASPLGVVLIIFESRPDALVQVRSASLP